MKARHHTFFLLLLLLLWVEATLQSLEEAPLVAVYAVRGETTDLPCSLTRAPPEDSVILVLWYRNDTKTPVFSVDSRKFSDPSVKRDGRRKSPDGFQGRARFQEGEQGERDWALVVKDVAFSDQGEYRCRLDFQSSPTHNARVLLHVVDVPRRLEVFSGGGAAVEGVVSVQEGRPLTLSCRAHGGEPQPNVTWWSGDELIDSEVEDRMEVPVTTTISPDYIDYPSPSFDSYPSSSPSSSNPATPPDTQSTNILHLDSVTSAHLSRNLTCLAANTPVLTPLSATFVLLDTAEESVTVDMKALPPHLSGGRTYNVTCLSSGVWPAPLLVWRLRGKKITKNVHLRHPGSDITESVLALRASMGDDGSLLECQASSATLPHLTASDSTRLTVRYIPQATISIEGRAARGGGREAGLEAGDSASLTCTARANPPAYNFTFLLNGRPLHRANVVESGQSLTLLELTHKDAGLYTCVASNSEGDGQSNAVPLHIDFPPVCAWEGVKEKLAVVGEKVRMDCKVLASPPDVTFTWEKVTFTANMTQLRSPLQHDDTGLTSTGWATAEGNLSSTQGAMRAECQPRNDLGRADHPCVFAIRIVGDPSPLTGCYHHDVTADSASVTCEDVTSPKYLANTYYIQVKEGGLVAASFHNSVPRFNLTSLAPGRDYTLVLHVSHAKGRSPDTHLTLRTHTPKAEQVAPERIPVELKKPGEDAPQPTDSPRGLGGTPLSVVVSGAVVGVVVGVAVVVAGVVTCRARRGTGSSPGKAHHHHHHVSRDSLLEMPSQGALFQPYSSSSPPSCELLTTFSPGPVVVTQVTSARSSRRSSPLMRKSSTRSAPGGSSPRGIRPRAASCRGGPVHVLEVEADDVTTPRVEVHSPSRLSRLSLRNLRRRGSQPVMMNRESQSVLNVETQSLGLEVPSVVPTQQPQPPVVSGECQQVPDATQGPAGQTEEQQMNFDSLQPALSAYHPQTDAQRPQGDLKQAPPPLIGPYVHLTPPPGHASPTPVPQPPSPQYSQHHLSPHSASHPIHHPPPQHLHPQIQTVTLPQPMYPTTLPHMATIPIVEPPPQTPLSPVAPQLRTSALLLRTTPQFTITIPHGTYTIAGDHSLPHLQQGLVPTQPLPPPRRNTISASTTSLPHAITTIPHLPQNATPTTTVLYANHPAHHRHHTATTLPYASTQPYTTTQPRGGAASETGGTLSRLASQIHPMIQGESGVPLQVLYLPPESNTSHFSSQDIGVDPLCTSTSVSPSTTTNNVYSTFR